MDKNCKHHRHCRMECKSLNCPKYEKCDLRALEEEIWEKDDRDRMLRTYVLMP